MATGPLQAQGASDGGRQDHAQDDTADDDHDLLLRDDKDAELAGLGSAGCHGDASWGRGRLTLRAWLWYLTAFLVSDTARST